MKALLIALAVLLALCAVLFALWRRSAQARKKAQARCAELEGTLHSVLSRLSAVQEAARIAADNRREADEKIEALHSGDACGNALDELSKREGVR